MTFLAKSEHRSDGVAGDVVPENTPVVRVGSIVKDNKYPVIPIWKSRRDITSNRDLNHQNPLIQRIISSDWWPRKLKRSPDGVADDAVPENTPILHDDKDRFVPDKDPLIPI